MSTGRVVHKPPPKHYCRPGTVVKDGFVHLFPGITVGTVWECECGLTHVAEPSRYSNVFTVVWRLETRRERRRRERRARWEVDT